MIVKFISQVKGGRVGICAPPIWTKEIHGLLVPPSNAYNLLTDHLKLRYRSGSSLLRESGFKSNHPYWIILDSLDVMTS